MIATQPSAVAATTGTVNERAVVFTNRNGLRLFGILHVPAQPRRDAPAVLLLSPGVKMRVGPERLYRRMARQFAEAGLVVLRFDFHGLGDSEGSLAEEQLRDVYNHIEVGRYVDDTIDAMNWMLAEMGTQQFILSGLCGGAITGLLTGQRDRRVAGLLALGITPLLASRNADPSKYMTRGQLQNISESYIRKLTSPGAWLRLLTFRSDYRLLWRAMVTAKRAAPAPPAAAPAAPTSPATPGTPGATTAPATATQAAAEDNASPLFPPAFFEMLRTRRPMLLIFGGADRLHFEFEEKFRARHGQRLAELPQAYEVHVIDKANHVLGSEDWQREMLAVSARWLDTHFTGGRAGVV